MSGFTYYLSRLKELGIKKSIELFKYNFLNLPKKYYSEWGEDILLSGYCKKEKGFFVDIGAYHPKRASNTCNFYRKGWSGINIEPNPFTIKSFRRQRKRDINLNLGVSDVKGELDYFVYSKRGLGNTFSIGRNQLVHDDNGAKATVLKINVDTINNILNTFLPFGVQIDFLTIDVEGLELTILKSLDYEKFSPNLILVEDLFFYDQDMDILDYHKSELYTFLKSKNYILVGKTWYTLLFKKIKIL